MTNVERQMSHDEQAQRIVELERELNELRASVPAHSIKPAMLLRMEELEEALNELLAEQQTPSQSAASNPPRAA